MGIIRKYNFSIDTGFIGGKINEVVEIEIDDNLNKAEIYKKVNEEFNDWIYNKIETNWEEIYE